MKPTIFLVAALMLIPLSHAEGKAKVFILSGQSNMAGGGDVVEEGLGFDTVVGDQVQIWDASGYLRKKDYAMRWMSLNQLQREKAADNSNRIGPEFGFAKAMAKKFPADRIHLIKVARGGKAIAEFLPHPKAKPNEYTAITSNLESALAKIEGEYEIVGMLWMQGESDSKKQADAQAYQEKLEQFIALMREKTGKPDLPFVIGRLSSRILESPKFRLDHAKIVQSAQEAVANKDKHAYLIHTDDLSQRDDLVHFDQQGQMDLGKRFGEAMIAALE